MLNHRHPLAGLKSNLMNPPHFMDFFEGIIAFRDHCRWLRLQRERRSQTKAVRLAVINHFISR